MPIRCTFHFPLYHFPLMPFPLNNPSRCFPDHIDNNICLGIDIVHQIFQFAEFGSGNGGEDDVAIIALFGFAG